MQCQTLIRPTAPGRAMTVLLGACRQSDVADDAGQVLCILTGNAGLPAAEREDSPDRSGLMGVNTTMSAASVYVPLRGRTPLRTAAPRVQTFYCGWWQSLIMCSTKQEPGLHSRAAARWSALVTHQNTPFSLDAIWLGRFNFTSAKYQDLRRKRCQDC